MACEGTFGRAVATLDVVVASEPLQGVLAEYFSVDAEQSLCEAEPQATLVVTTVDSTINHPYQDA